MSEIKKSAEEKRRKYGPDYRRCRVPPSPSEPAVCTRSPECEGCPFPRSGFICWGENGECMKTRLQKLQGKEDSK